MSSAALQREAFMPRSPGGMGPGLALALGVHALLVVALAFSVSWRSSTPVAAEAELWGAVPQVAAPRAAEPEPPPPKPEPVKPPPPPPPVARAEPEPPKVPDAQIAIEKAKREKALEQLREQKEKEALEKKLKKEEEQERKAEKARKAEEARQAEEERREEERQAAAREANIKRILGQANATGAADAKGTAQESRAISASYAGRIRARVKPNIIFNDDVEGNPTAEVEVRCAPDGKILSRKLLKSSGVRSWDDAVLRAIDKTEVFPLDDGHIPPVMQLAFRPRGE